MIAVTDSNLSRLPASFFEKRAPRKYEWPERDPARFEKDPIFGEKDPPDPNNPIFMQKAPVVEVNREERGPADSRTQGTLINIKV